MTNNELLTEILSVLKSMTALDTSCMYPVLAENAVFASTPYHIREISPNTFEGEIFFPHRDAELVHTDADFLGTRRLVYETIRKENRLHGKRKA